MRELQTVKWKTIRAGQPAPYKDSFYEYEVEFDGKKHKSVVRNFARFLRGCLLFADEAKERGTEGYYFSPHLTLKELPDNKWNILIIEHYTG